MRGSLSRKKTIFLLITFLSVFAIASGVLALELDWPPSPRGTTFTDESEITDMVQYFYEWGITLGGLATFFALIMGGVQYLTSVGRPAAMAEARDRIQSAVFGLVLLLSSWLILNTINPQLTTLTPPVFNIEDLGEIELGLGETPPEAVPCREATFYGSPFYVNPIGDPLAVDAAVVKLKPYSVKTISQDGEVCGEVTTTTIEEVVGTTTVTRTIQKALACACSVQLFRAGGWWIFEWGCGDKIGEIPPTYPNIARVVDPGQIGCVRLISQTRTE